MRRVDHQPAAADQERRFIFVEAGTAIFLHPQIAMRYTLRHAVVEDHGAVHHELHEAERLLDDGAVVVAPRLRGDDAGQFPGQKPGVQPVDLLAARRRVGQQGENDIQRVKHDASRPHGLDLRVERRQHPAQIEVAGLDQVRRRLGIEEEQLFFAQGGQLPTEAFGIGHEPLRAFLKGDEDAWLRAMPCAMGEELQGEDGLAGTRSADQQRGPAARQAAAGYLIEPGNAGRRFAGRTDQGRRQGLHSVSCGNP